MYAIYSPKPKSHVVIKSLSQYLIQLKVILLAAKAFSFHEKVVNMFWSKEFKRSQWTKVREVDICIFKLLLDFILIYNVSFFFLIFFTQLESFQVIIIYFKCDTKCHHIIYNFHSYPAWFTSYKKYRLVFQ